MKKTGKTAKASKSSKTTKSKATKAKQPRQPFSPLLTRRLHEGMLIVTIAVGAFMLMSFVSFHASDPGWRNLATGQVIENVGGRVGAWVADVFLLLFGYIAYLFPLMIVFAAYLGVRGDRDTDKETHKGMFSLRLVGFVLMLLASSGLLSLLMPNVHAHLPGAAGGVIGNGVGLGLASLFNKTGATLIQVAIFLSAVTMYTGYSWFKLAPTFLQTFFASFKVARNAVVIMKEHRAEWKEQKAEVRAEKQAKKMEQQRQQAELAVTQREPEIIKPQAPPSPEPEQTGGKVLKMRPPKAKAEPVAQPAPVAPTASPGKAPADKEELVIGKMAKKQKTNLFEIKSKAGLPALDLLEKPSDESVQGFSDEDLKMLSVKVEQCLKDFNVLVKVVAVQPGPVITRFELELAPGIKAAKLTSLATDLARSLSVTSVRVVEVIPGKSVVGIELPNEHREMVRIREMFSSKSYQDSKSPLTVVLGKDIAGYPVSADLGKMPHLLVAGTTGSGKSVGVNAMILSVLYKSTPEQVRFIMIDPKMLELSIYEGIPHLLTPVITDMNEAANGLRWCVAEMERRYKYMAAVGVRNLAGYNEKVNEAIKANKPIKDPVVKVESEDDREDLAPLPYIVVVIDEFADMMMVVGKKVETLIARIAQKARAAGIHLIVATQRPSVDIITGVIKSNIPTRIAFQVSSRIDSRTVLDQQGAEQLLGHGDMLYQAAGTGLPIRVHGAFVSDDEVHATVKDWKSRGEPSYISEITCEASDDDGADAGGDGDEKLDALYDQAVKIVTESNKASISYVQRRLRIGFNRSANILDQMEAQGVVSSMDESGRREVLAPAPAE